MTAKKMAITPDENKKIWGWYDEEGNINEKMTRSQAEKEALQAKGEFPESEVFIFKMVASVENTPVVKEL